MQQSQSKSVELNHEDGLSSIEIKLGNVEFQIRKKGVYSSSYDRNTIEISLNSSNDEISNNDHFYRVKITNGEFTYTGITNDNLKRNGLGLNEYKNGDKYLGGWINDKKDNKGVIIHKPVGDHSELFIGDWKDGVKNFGVYIWKKDNLPNEKCDLDVYIGKFTDGQISKGLYVSRVTKGGSTNEIFYFGKFDQDGKKKDDDALYYNKATNTIFKGEICDNELLKGFVKTMDDGKVFYFEKEEGKTFTNDEIEKAELDAIEISFQDLLKIVTGTNVFASSLDMFKNAENQFTKVTTLDSVGTESFAEIQGNLKEYLNVSTFTSHLVKKDEEDDSVKSAHKLKDEPKAIDDKHQEENEKNAKEEKLAKEDNDEKDNYKTIEPTSPEKSKNAAKNERKQRKSSKKGSLLF